MHLPDGFLDAKTVAVTAVLAGTGVGLALRAVRRELPPRRRPLLGLAAAFIFAAQMVNFPVLGGTSGHLIGGTLVAALLGPGAAVVVMTTVLIVQCFLFGDGGVSTLGANIFNMGIVSVSCGYAVYRLLARGLPGLRGRVAALAFAAWISTGLAAVTCAGELAWSGRVPWATGFTAMVSVHLLIGIGEGLISALVFLAVHRTRPEVITDTGRPLPAGELIRYGLLAALGVAVFVAPFACPWPDGLAAVAARLGFEPRAATPLLPAPLADYQIPGLHWGPGATALAGGIGSLVVFALALALGKWLVPPPAPQSGESPRNS